MKERLDMIWVKAWNRKTAGIYRSLHRTEEGERIWATMVFFRGKTRLRVLWADGPWRGSDGRPHRFKRKDDALFIGRLALSVWPFIKGSRSEVNQKEAAEHES